MAKFCRVSVKCYKCKMIGDHHTAFCRGNERYRTSKDRYTEATDEFTTTCLINENKSILLPTAMCNLIGNNDRTVAVKALFHSGSQQTYIANHLVKVLNLKLREVNMLVQTYIANHLVKVLNLKLREVNMLVQTYIANHLVKVLNLKLREANMLSTNVYCESPCQSSQFKVKSSEYVLNKRILRITLSKFSI